MKKQSSRASRAKKAIRYENHPQSFSVVCTGILWRISLAIWPRGEFVEDAKWEPGDMPKGKFFFSFLGSITSVLFMVLSFAEESFLDTSSKFYLFVDSQIVVLLVVLTICILQAALFAYMIARGKISGALRAYWRGILVPLSVFVVIAFAVGRLT